MAGTQCLNEYPGEDIVLGVRITHSAKVCHEVQEAVPSTPGSAEVKEHRQVTRVPTFPASRASLAHLRVLFCHLCITLENSLTSLSLNVDICQMGIIPPTG